MIHFVSYYFQISSIFLNKLSMADDLDIDALLEAPYEKKDDVDRNGDRYVLFCLVLYTHIFC